MDEQRGIDDIWSLVNYDLSIARKALDRAAESAKTAGLRAAANNSEMERLRGVLAGRSVPPTAAEVAAHHAAGGKWRVVEHECERMVNGRTHMRLAAERTLRVPEHIAAYKCDVEDCKIPTTWWALDEGYLLTAWPQAEAPAPVAPAPPASDPKIIGSGRIEPVGNLGMILAGLPEDFVAADDRWLTTRQGRRYSRADGVSLDAEFRVTPSDLAKINATLNNRPSYAVEALMAFEKSMERP